MKNDSTNTLKIKINLCVETEYRINYTYSPKKWLVSDIKRVIIKIRINLWQKINWALPKTPEIVETVSSN